MAYSICKKSIQNAFFNSDKKCVLLAYIITMYVIEFKITDMHRQDHQLEQSPFELLNNLLTKVDLLQLF